MSKQIRNSKLNPTKRSAGKLDAVSATDAADWRSETLESMRALILEALPEAVEEVKWRKPSNNMAGVPVWSHHGIICTGETYKEIVKLTFAKGASVPDPSRLFNSSLEGNTRRAIDIRRGQMIDSRAFKALIKAAAALNAAPVAKAAKPMKAVPQAKAATGAIPSRKKATANGKKATR